MKEFWVVNRPTLTIDKKTGVYIATDVAPVELDLVSKAQVISASYLIAVQDLFAFAKSQSCDCRETMSGHRRCIRCEVINNYEKAIK